MKIEITKLNKNSKIPIRATRGSAGFDLFTCIDGPEIIIDPGETKTIKTGIAVAIPDGSFGMICSRSGLSTKFGIIITNSPGIIDADYRGELMCILRNISQKSFAVEDGMRVAQLLIMKHTIDAEFQEVPILSTKTDRNNKGFGSTGL